MKDRTSDYLEANDEVKEWFDTEYVKGEKEDYVQIKDVYERFVASDLFQNLSKKERRDNSKKAFTERIIKNINFKNVSKRKIGWKNASINGLESSPKGTN